MPTLYDSTVPAYIHGLESLSTILSKAVTHNKESPNPVPEKEILDGRLQPDMFGLIFQIQSVSDTAKNSVARISNDTIAQLPMEDNEATFDDLQARIAKTIDFLKAAKPENLNGNEELTIKPKLGPHEVEFKVQDYVRSFAIPNFYFHLSMAYAILRSRGVPVGKLDFLGMKFPAQE